MDKSVVTKKLKTYSSVLVGVAFYAVMAYFILANEGSTILTKIVGLTVSAFAALLFAQHWVILTGYMVIALIVLKLFIKD